MSKTMRLFLPIILFTSACTLLQVVPDSSIPQESTPEILPTSEWGIAITDELEVMEGICFESAFDARNRVFVLRSTEELSSFFDLADNSHLCRHPVTRGTFNFENGRILAGLWSDGHGCTARHDIQALERDETAKKLNIQLKLLIEGDCPYELVRPFWIGLSDVSDYEIQIEVE